jgi:lycopene beta-cyclase
MTYLQFHLVFILPPLLLLAPLLPRAIRSWGGRAAWTIPAVAAIALVYTTPWDNYLVYRGVWWYGADRVMGTIGYVPVEEYLFFVLQPLLTGLFTYLLLLRERTVAAGALPSPAPRDVIELIGDARLLGVGIYLLLAAAGALALTYASGLYMGLILAWAGPVLAAQWYFSAPAVLRRPRTFVLAAGVPTLYLWVVDRIAISAGIWSISPEATTGLHLVGLPIEEALFFLVTNLLVVQGVLLFLAPALDAARPGNAAPTARGRHAAQPIAQRGAVARPRAASGAAGSLPPT